jgi:K+-transporting ATPase A subunit
MRMAYLIGIGLGALVFVFGRLVGLDRDRAFYPTVLAVVATYYSLFAVMAGSTVAIAAESAAAALFFAATVIGFRHNLWIVVAGLVAHGLFDSIHDHVIANPGMPKWWPIFCGTIDVALGVGLAWLLLRNKLRAEAP